MDPVFLDDADHVLELAAAARPWRFRGHRRAAAVGELAPGAAGLIADEPFRFGHDRSQPPRRTAQAAPACAVESGFRRRPSPACRAVLNPTPWT